MSSEIARLVAHSAFWGILLIAWFWDDLGRRTGAAFVALWVAGYVGSAYVPQGTYLLTSYVAILDVVLVLVVFKGDVRLG